MLSSTISWQHKDYMRLVEWLYKDLRISDAEKCESYINRICPPGAYTARGTYWNSEKLRDLAAEKARKEGTNLLCTSSMSNGSEDEMIYQNRVYSIDRINNMFPFYKIVPVECRLQYYPFYQGISILYDDDGHEITDVVKWSNRPFRYKLSQQEIDAYQAYQDEQFKRNRRWFNLKVYYTLQANHPGEYTKSRTSFTRLEKTNKEEYDRLVALADVPEIKK